MDDEKTVRQDDYFSIVAHETGKGNREIAKYETWPSIRRSLAEVAPEQSPFRRSRLTPPHRLSISDMTLYSQL